MLALCVCVLSCVCLFVTLWTVAHQAPLSMGFLQARLLEWVAISYSRGSSHPRDRALSHVSCISRWVLYHWEAQVLALYWLARELGRLIRSLGPSRRKGSRTLKEEKRDKYFFPTLFCLSYIRCFLLNSELLWQQYLRLSLSPELIITQQITHLAQGYAFP